MFIKLIKEGKEKFKMASESNYQICNIIVNGVTNILIKINRLPLIIKEEDKETLKKLNWIDAKSIGLSSLEEISILVSSSVVVILIDNNPLSSLRGIEKFINLRQLSATNCQISSLEELKELSELNYLEFYGNQIVSIEPLKYLNNLSNLRLVNNYIVDTYPLAKLEKLRILSINENYGIKLDGVMSNPNCQKESDHPKLLKKLRVICNTFDPRLNNSYKWNYYYCDHFKSRELTDELNFKNYKFRLKWAEEILLNLVIRKKIILLWLAFFEEKRDLGGFNRLSYLAQ